MPVCGKPLTLLRRCSTLAGRRWVMLDEQELRAALFRHWEYSGKDEDVVHEIYHHDAVLEFPQSGERFGVETSGSGVAGIRRG